MGKVHTPTVLHLFSGAGGGAIGFHRAGFRSLGAVDSNPEACADLEYLTGEKATVADLGAMTPVECFPAPSTERLVASQGVTPKGPFWPWDSAIINWYPPGSSLGWHRDIHEADRTLPIVTISLGDACSWAIRADEESPVCRCRLETGHITLLAGEKRLWLHTVERVIPAPMFSPLGTRTRGRLSITIRVAGGAG